MVLPESVYLAGSLAIAGFSASPSVCVVFEICNASEEVRCTVGVDALFAVVTEVFMVGVSLCGKGHTWRCGHCRR